MQCLPVAFQFCLFSGETEQGAQRPEAPRPFPWVLCKVKAHLLLHGAVTLPLHEENVTVVLCGVLI